MRTRIMSTKKQEMPDKEAREKFMEENKDLLFATLTNKRAGKDLVERFRQFSGIKVPGCMCGQAARNSAQAYILSLLKAE